VTPTEEAAVKAAIEQITRDAHDDGIKTAAMMVRMTGTLRPEMTFEQLAEAIEATVGGRSDG
jgi:hypothetical protein